MNSISTVSYLQIWMKLRQWSMEQAPSVLSRLTCQASCHGFPVMAVLSQPYCSCTYVPSSSVSAVLLHHLCADCPATVVLPQSPGHAVLSWLSCSNSPAWAVLSWLSCSGGGAQLSHRLLNPYGDIGSRNPSLIIICLSLHILKKRWYCPMYNVFFTARWLLYIK